VIQSASETVPPPVAEADASATTLPPGISPNSILVVAFIPPVVEPTASFTTEAVLPPPPAENPSAVTAPSSEAESCPLCQQRFTPLAVVRSNVTDVDMSCACCRRGGLTDRDFSMNQQSRDESVRRCLTCVQGGVEPLEIIRARSPAGIALAAKKQQALEKRRATIARKKLEKQQQELQRQQQQADGVIPSSDSDSGQDEDEVMNGKEKAVRDILTSARSIYRRQEVIDLDGPDREAYELQLLDEEAALHEQSASLCLQNATVYDRVCEKLLVIDGKVKLGERDHEQGEFDGDKPNHRVTKNGTTRIVHKKPDDRTLERCEALLHAAKATAEARRQALGFDAVEPPRKRVKRVDADGIEMAVLNRPQRRVAKPATYVLYD
jgi:hypothetical protein